MAVFTRSYNLLNVTEYILHFYPLASSCSITDQWKVLKFTSLSVRRSSRRVDSGHWGRLWLVVSTGDFTTTKSLVFQGGQNMWMWSTAEFVWFVSRFNVAVRLSRVRLIDWFHLKCWPVIATKTCIIRIKMRFVRINTTTNKYYLQKNE